MPAKGGASPYRKGAARERIAKKAYEDAGWFVVRSPQSGSPVDLVALPEVYGSGRVGIHLVQVKTQGYLRPRERQAVVDLAVRYGAVPVLAWGASSVHRLNLATGEELDDLSSG